MSRNNDSIGKHARPEDAQSAGTALRAPKAGATVQMNAVPAAQPQQEGAFRSAAPAYDAAFNTAAYNNAAAYTAAAAQARGKGKKTVAKATGIVIGVLVAVYLIGFGVFSNMFYPNTTFDGNDISFKDSGYLTGLINNVADDYALTVTGDGVSFTISSDEAGVSIDADSAARQALADNHAYAWPVEVFQRHDEAQNLQATYNEDSLKQVVTAQVESFNKSATDPVNANIGYDSNSGTFQVTQEKAGTKLDSDAVETAVEQAISEMATTVSLSNDELVQPTVLSDNDQLQQAAQTANSYLGADIELVLGSTAIHAGEVNADQISKWVTVGDDLSVTFDSDAMKSWVKDLASSINTVGTSRTFNSTTDGTITVSGGTYGWTVDQDKLVSEVEDAVSNGTKGQITVPTKGEGYTWAGQGAPDWGAYAEVDISDQHAWFYDADGTLEWDTDVVTGKPGHDTPTGIWKVLNKATDYTLTGDQTASGEPEYETPVSYWMPFTSGGVGFHDATWQSAFGGTRYQDGHGSHGCVNLPLDKAKALYSLIQVNNAVIVHE